MSARHVAVVTGASKGLGLAMAQHLASEGSAVVLVARPSDYLEKAARDIEEAGGTALAVGADIRDPEAVSQAAATVRERFGHVDLLVNNAGLCTTGKVEDLPIEAIERDVDVSLLGTILVTRAFMPMVQRGGHLLFISSGFGLTGAAGYSVYCATKAGQVNFADAIRREVRSRGIAVHVATPSDIDTPGFREEIETMPEWLSAAAARGKPIPASEAARRILRQCHGRRFYVFSDPMVRLLYLVNKASPLFLRNAILDALFPAP